MQIICQYTDGGRSNSRKRKKQRNDCTVIAYALALDLSYDESYDTLANAGRKSGRGFHMEKFMDERWYNRQRFLSLSNTEFGGQHIKQMSVFQLINSELLSKGKFIIGVHRHVFTVIDGVIHDSHLIYVRGNYPQIQNAWQVIDYKQRTRPYKISLCNLLPEDARKTRKKT